MNGNMLLMLIIVILMIVQSSLCISMPKIYCDNSIKKGSSNMKYAAVLPGSPLVVGTLTQGYHRYHLCPSLSSSSS